MKFSVLWTFGAFKIGLWVCGVRGNRSTWPSSGGSVPKGSSRGNCNSGLLWNVPAPNGTYHILQVIVGVRDGWYGPGGGKEIKHCCSLQRPITVQRGPTPARSNEDNSCLLDLITFQILSRTKFSLSLIKQFIVWLSGFDSQRGPRE